MTSPNTRKHIVAAGLGLASVAAMATGFLLSETPAQAIPVFDASNYAQNLLVAARALDQVNNQIKSLQNEASMLINQAKNLARIDFPQLREITTRLQQIDRLMGQAQGIRFKVEGLDDQFRRLFPGQTGAGGSAAQLASARLRLDTAMAALRQTMTVQAQVVENVEVDAATLGELVGRSQQAEGALQATQATNQLLALSAKQQFQIQQLLAAQYRAEAMDTARRTQSESDARAATTRFLGSGSAYPPR